MHAESAIREGIEYNIPHLPVSVLMSWVVWIVLGCISTIIVRRAQQMPGRGQLLFESIFSYIFSTADQLIGATAQRYYPLLTGLFVFILTGNLIGLIPGLRSPTADPNTTFGLAISVFLFYTFEGLRMHGLNYFKHILGPPMPWYLFPVRIIFMLIEILTLFIRPFSLGMRLFCNLFSKELFLTILAILIVQFIASPALIDRCFSGAPIVLRPIILLLGLIIGIIQAVVFTVLSTSYIAGAVHAGDH